MAIDPEKFAVDQLSRVLETFDWRVIAVSYEGTKVTVTIEKSKDKILKP